MKNFLISSLCLVLSFTSLKAQQNANTFAESISEADLSKHLHIIASDSLEGRMTGEEGQKKAATYISNHFKALGLTPPVNGSYLQPFQLVKRSWKRVYMRSASNETLKFKEDFFAVGNSNFKEETALDLVFIQNGEVKQFQNRNVKGKAVLMLLDKNEDINKKANFARQRGAKTVLVVIGKTQEVYEEELEYNARFLNRGTRTLSHPNPPEEAIFFLSPQSAAKLLKIKPEQLFKIKETANQPLYLKAEKKEEVLLASENVLGFMEGSDKKDEILVITAHYDHIGKEDDGSINNGADDDGSGTVAVLEIAEAFAKAKAAGKGPRRSILFMTVAGEELGLFGSRYYTDVEPIFPLENTVADLNIDMIGRIGGDYVAKNDPNYVYLIGSDKLSSDLHKLSEEMNDKYTKLKLDYKYNDENDPNRFYYRSDHYNFAKNNIPIIFYFNGTHEDYHQPTDTVDKIHFPKLEKISRLVFYTAWEIANRDERLKVDKKGK